MEVTPEDNESRGGVTPKEWSSGPLNDYWRVTDCKHVTAKFVRNGYPLASIQEVQSRFVEFANAKQTTD
jgi:type I restriction enzyme S subunit